jgi:hypothetical protein
MTKNQKIAAGCGAVGCLGLIVVSIAVGAVLYFRSQQTSYADRRGRTFNFNVNVNSNQNSNVSANENSNNSSSSSSSTTFSDDDKHKLFQAASMSQDADLLQKVVKKLGLFKADGTPADEYPEFIKDHIVWGASNTDFISSLNTPEKARAYVDAHLGE